MSPEFVNSGMQQHKYFYERNLPHYQPQEATYFITYRLHGSIPVSKIKELKEEQQLIKKINKNLNEEQVLDLHANYFRKFDRELDKSLNEPYRLKKDEIASVVSESLHFNDRKEYELWCFTIMPNHVHVLLTLLEKSLPLYALLQKHKRFTAWQCNLKLNRNGSFWHKESYDHVIRNNRSFNRIVAYILNNPVKAGLVNRWDEWKWTYLSPALR
jgi:putative transposase